MDNLRPGPAAGVVAGGLCPQPLSGAGSGSHAAAGGRRHRGGAGGHGGRGRLRPGGGHPLRRRLLRRVGGHAPGAVPAGLGGWGRRPVRPAPELRRIPALRRRRPGRHRRRPGGLGALYGPCPPPGPAGGGRAGASLVLVLCLPPLSLVFLGAAADSLTISSAWSRTVPMETPFIRLLSA